MMLAVYTFVFSVIFKARWGAEVGDSKVAFAITMFCGIAVFNIFSESIIGSVSVITGNKNYVKKVEEEGYDATTFKVDLNAKIAFPFICIIMVLTGAATGMRPFAKNNIPAAIAIGVVIAFLYWAVYGFCLSLGYGTILPPIVSAWTTNLFFFCFGILYLVNAD